MVLKTNETALVISFIAISQLSSCQRSVFSIVEMEHCVLRQWRPLAEGLNSDITASALGDDSREPAWRPSAVRPAVTVGTAATRGSPLGTESVEPRWDTLAGRDVCCVALCLEFEVRPGEGDGPVSGAACWAYTLYIKVLDLKMLLQVKV